MTTATAPVQAALLPAARPEILSLLIDLADLPTDDTIDSQPPERSLVESIVVFGIQQPITVMVKDDPTKSVQVVEYVLIDGRRRVKAARAAGLTNIPARIVLGDIGQTLTPGMQALSVQLNTVRRDNPLADLRNLLDLVDALTAAGIPEERIEKELARVTHMPRATIWRRMQLKLLLPEFLGA